MKKRSPISLGLYPWIADTVYQLATNSNPAVTVQFREEILAEKITAELREQAENHAPRTEILGSQTKDGSWPVLQDEAEGEEFFAIVRKLLCLHDLGVRRTNDQVKKAVRRIGSFQESDGGFPANYHHTALTLWVLAMYGLGKSPVAKKILKFFDRTRRADSGWLDPKLEPALAEQEDSLSCPWTTLHVVLAYSEFPDQRRSMDVRKGAVFLLDRIFKRSHMSFFGHPDHWRELDYGYDGTSCFKWAIPKMLLILGRLGCGAETNEVAEFITFLRKTMRSNGRWGANLEGDDFLTMRILRGLMAVQEAGAQ